MYNVGTKRADGVHESIRGTAEAPNPAVPGKLLVTFPLGKPLLYPNPAVPGKLLVTFPLGKPLPYPNPAVPGKLLVTFPLG